MSEITPVLTADAVGARIDRLQKVPLGAAGFTGLFLCYFFANYDIGVFSLIVPSLMREFHLQPIDLGAPVFWNLAGYGVGAYFFGYVADRWGRQRGLFLTIIVLSVGGFLSALSWDIFSFSLFRFIAGAGMGAVLAVCATYLSEVAPARMRGRYLAILYTVQAVIAVVIGFVSLPILGWGGAAGGSGAWGWRVLLGFGGLAILALAFLHDRGMTESPRWLIESGKPEKARRNLEILEARIGAGALPDPIDDSRSRPLPEPAESETRVKPLTELFRAPYAARLGVILFFWLLYYVAAYGWLSYTTIILPALGISESNALFQTVASRVTGVAVPFLMIWLIEKVERRTLIIQGGAMMVLAMLSLLLPIGDVRGLIASILMILGISWSVMPAYIYTAEIFSTRSRGTASSIADGVGHMGGAIAPFVVLPVLAAAGGIAGIGVIMACAAVASAIVFLGPRTKGRKLSEISRAQSPAEAPEPVPSIE